MCRSSMHASWRSYPGYPCPASCIKITIIEDQLELPPSSRELTTKSATCPTSQQPAAGCGQSVSGCHLLAEWSGCKRPSLQQHVGRVPRPSPIPSAHDATHSDPMTRFCPFA